MIRIFFLLGLMAAAGCAPTVNTRLDRHSLNSSASGLTRKVERATAQFSPLYSSAQWLREGLSTRDAATASELFLSSAKSAWQVMAKSSVSPNDWAQDKSAQLYNSAVAAFVQRNSVALARGDTLTFHGPEGEFVVTTTFRGDLRKGFFDRLLVADEIRIRGFSQRSLIPGMGAAVVGERERTPEREQEMQFHAPRRGIFKSLNVLLDFGSGDRVNASVTDLTENSFVTISGRSVPLSGDFTAPIALAMSGKNDLLIGLTGLFDVRSRISMAGIYMAEPFDKDRIPVLMIHGLGSSPLIWREMTAEAMRDQQIRENYQFWYVFYPSGLPIVSSLDLLRTEIARMRKLNDPGNQSQASKHLVVVGHSMGAVISRALSKNVGVNLWNAIAREPIEKARLPENERTRLRRVLFWEPVPGIERGVYIAGPHRGATLADSSFTQLLVRLISLPVDMVNTQRQILRAAGDILRSDFHAAQFTTSLNSLSPSYPLFEALNKSPGAKRYRFSSVIGDRGRGDTPNSTDGIVAYWSSHLDGAQNEVIVPTTHANTFKHPLAVEEVKNSLLLNLKRNGGSAQTRP